MFRFHIHYAFLITIFLAGTETASATSNPSSLSDSTDVATTPATAEQIRELVLSLDHVERTKVGERPYMGVTQTITVDSRQTDACRQSLMEYGELNVEELCRPDKANPYVTVLASRATSDGDYAEIRRTLSHPARNIELSAMQKEARTFVVVGAGMMVFLSSLPSSVTKWTPENQKSALQKYRDNVRNGPVWDHDKAVINYVAHPYVGAIYYSAVRHRGYSARESAGFAAIMSTIYWEYGFEAIAEKPSIQDLIVTPLLGSLIGEVFYKWSLEIDANRGQVLGSRGLGQVAQFALNPVGSLTNSINKLFDGKVIQSSEVQLRTYTAALSSEGRRRNATGLFFEIKY